MEIKYEITFLILILNDTIRNLIFTWHDAECFRLEDWQQIKKIQDDFFSYKIQIAFDNSQRVQWTFYLLFEFYSCMIVLVTVKGN